MTKMMQRLGLVCLWLLMLAPALPAADHFIDEGMMAAMVAEDGALLQARIRPLSPEADEPIIFELATDPDFNSPRRLEPVQAGPLTDHIAKLRVDGLQPATRYWARPTREVAGVRSLGRAATFRTLGGAAEERPLRLAIITCMNYAFFMDGNPHAKLPPYAGPDKELGFPGLAAVLERQPDYLVGTGDNVYFDHPRGPLAARTESELRRKYREIFTFPRMIELLAAVPSYWEKDDHDFRYDDADWTGDEEPSPELGIRIFHEQLPVVDPADPEPVTYNTWRLNRDLQIWLVEGRDYRSPNKMEDGPEKSIWGERQRQWLMETLAASDATFKLLISATPMVGPDDARKSDNHTNIGGFRHERDQFFDWLLASGIDLERFAIINGDRHWQYHSIHPTGVHEFSCGSLVDQNSRLGRAPGDPASTDPKAEIVQPYLQPEAKGGFIEVEIAPATGNQPALQTIRFFDSTGKLYEEVIRGRGAR